MTDKEAIIFFWGDPDLKDTYNCTCVFEEILISRENFDFYYDNGDRKSTRLNSSHSQQSRMPSSA